MKFFNNEKYISNYEIEKCLLKYDEKLQYGNLTVVIVENRKDIFKMKYINDLYISNTLRKNKLVYSLLKLQDYIDSFSNESVYSGGINTIMVYLNNLYVNSDELKLQIISTIIYEVINSTDDLSDNYIKNMVIEFLNKNLEYICNILNISIKYNFDDII